MHDSSIFIIMKHTSFGHAICNDLSGDCCVSMLTSSTSAMTFWLPTANYNNGREGYLGSVLFTSSYCNNFITG